MKEEHSHLIEVLNIVERVRGEKGCPWIKEQTAEKHIKELKSEIEEVETALKNNDLENLSEELGDVLYDVLLLIKICEDEKNIDIKKTLITIRDKIIRRKPYVFGNEKAATAEEASKIWRRIKEEEKKG